MKPNVPDNAEAQPSRATAAKPPSKVQRTESEKRFLDNASTVPTREDPDSRGPFSRMTREHIAELVDELARARFFGSLELKFEAGHVVLLRKTETIKPKSESGRDTRGADGGRNR